MKKEWIKVYDRQHPFDVVSFDGVETLHDILEKFSKPNETKIKWINQETGVPERNMYKCASRNDRYIIWTKPFNLQKTYLYSIFDLEEMIAAPDNLVFGCYGYDTEEDRQEALEALDKGTMGLSYRRKVDIDRCVSEVWILSKCLGEREVK